MGIFDKAKTIMDGIKVAEVIVEKSKLKDIAHTTIPTHRFKDYMPKTEEDEKIEITANNILDAVSPVGIARKVFKNTAFIDDEYPSIGDHLLVQRVGYTHHGICIDCSGGVIHYLQDGIQIDHIVTFAKEEAVRIVKSPCKYDSYEVIERAKSRLGENEYNVVNNNCEHFARWCRNGDPIEY